MKSTFFSVCVVVAAVALLFVDGDGVRGSGPPSTQPTQIGAPDLVISFYKVLNQADAPTAAQEEGLFASQSSLRRFLVLGKSGQPAMGAEPMERTPDYFKQRAIDDRRVAAAGPVVLEYFRKHKDWFQPETNLSLGKIQISSEWQFVATAGGMKPVGKKPDTGFVLVLFTEKADAPPDKFSARTIVFRILDGKIDADAIYLDGFRSNRSTLHEATAEK